jgi:hypothetical protein
MIVTFVFLPICGMQVIERPREQPFAFKVTLGAFLLIPVLLSGSAGAGLGRLRPFFIQQNRFITFVATRPMTTGRLVAAKFRMALASVMITWALTIAFLAVWLITSGNTSMLTLLLSDFFRIYPGWRGVAILVLGAVLLPALTWRSMTSGVAPVIAGRRWLAESTSFVLPIFLMALCSGGVWLGQRPEHLHRLVAAIPVLVVCAAAVKAIVAFVTFRSVLRRRIMSWPALGFALGIWLAFTAAGVSLVLVAGLPAGFPVDLPIILLGIATFAPLVRYPIATLALEWNRRR